MKGLSGKAVRHANQPRNRILFLATLAIAALVAFAAYSKWHHSFQYNSILHEQLDTDELQLEQRR